MNRWRMPTIYDVAERAGVSIATVSRVLNAPERVRMNTRTRVLNAIQELGFMPRGETAVRQTPLVGRIGVLTPFFTYASFVQRMRGVAGVLNRAGYELIVYPLDSRDRLSGYLATLTAPRGLDGLIVMSLTLKDDLARRLLDSGRPAVMLEVAHPAFSNVVIDDVEGGELAADFLVKKGYRRMAFVGSGALPDYSLHPEDARLLGFRERLAQLGFPLASECIRYPALLPGENDSPLESLLDAPGRPQAIFTATDDLAIRVLQAARRRGLAVPGDVAVLGFDDIDLAEHMGLSTISQSLDDSGRMAAEILLDRLNNPAAPLQSVEIQLKVIQRQTT